MNQQRWSLDELRVALNLYLKMPFGQMHHSNRGIIELAGLLGRTPSSVAMRLSNFASCDPYLQARGIKGLRAGIPVCKPVWDEFEREPQGFLYESEKILASLEETSLEDKYGIFSRVEDRNIKPDELLQLVKTRLTHCVFRRNVLKNYNNQCAITCLSIPGLLVASHIIPWSVNKRERLNPENGICLSALYDKAFDVGYISFRDDLTIVLSQKLKAHSDKDWFSQYFRDLEDHHISAAMEYQPNPEFLAYHRDYIYQG